MPLLKPLENFLTTLDPASVARTSSYARMQELQSLSDYICSRSEELLPIRLVFVCTHNSRRSQFAQVWAKVAAYVSETPNVECFSAGTETTRLFPKVADTLEQVGFEVNVTYRPSNPIYEFRYADDQKPILVSSKFINDPSVPVTDFSATMVCSQADANCPVVLGASHKISLPFIDPKIADRTPQQEKAYAQANLEIAQHMFYAFLNSKL